MRVAQLQAEVKELESFVARKKVLHSRLAHFALGSLLFFMSVECALYIAFVLAGRNSI